MQWPELRISFRLRFRHTHAANRWAAEEPGPMPWPTTASAAVGPRPSEARPFNGCRDEALPAWRQPPLAPNSGQIRRLHVNFIRALGPHHSRWVYFLKEGSIGQASRVA